MDQLLLMMTMMAFFNVQVSPMEIATTKCCPDTYNILTDQCDDADPGTEAAVPPWSPPVYSRQENHTMTLASDTLLLNYSLNPCPEGSSAKITADFRFYDDGGLTTASGHLPFEDFCLDRVTTHQLSDLQFVARFCAPDPCGEASNCLRKCCPHGMAIDGPRRNCQWHPQAFAPVIRSDNGSVLNPADMLPVAAGRVPLCANALFFLRPDIYGEIEQFRILPSGQLEVLAYQHMHNQSNPTRNYCIDNILSNNITNTAIICLPEQPLESWTIIIYRYFLVVSSVFLVLTFAVYSAIPEIRNIHGVTIMCYVASMAVMYITFALIQFKFGAYGNPTSNRICIALAVIAHFSWLSSFTWINVMSFDVWWTFSDLKLKHSGHAKHRRRLGFRFLVYSIYAWGVPTLIVSIGQILDNTNVPHYIIKPNFGVLHCWFGDPKSQTAYLYGPLTMIIVSNTVFFVLTALQLYRASVDAAFATSKAHAKQKFRVIFSLFILMGISWMMEIISFIFDEQTQDYIWIPTDIINILTGVFVFVIFVCKRNIWKLLRQRYRSTNSKNTTDRSKAVETKP